MPEQPIALGFLFARLTHPEGMVRERACTAIARLLVMDDATDVTRERLALWMGEQQLESVAIFALLIWIRARIEKPETELPDIEGIMNSFPRHSLLSWLLLKDLYGPDCSEPNWQYAFSEGLGRDFEPDSFFLRHAIHFVPPIYAETANRIARETRSPFVSQWAWEWSRLLELLSVVPDEHVLRSRGDSDSDLHVCYDSRLSEIYRSAYLRTLSWAVFHEIIDRNDGLMHAAKCCPVDVGLWQISLGRSPNWWPVVAQPGDTIDDSVEQVMEAMRGLFQKQIQSKEDWSLVQSSGLILGEHVNIELEIYGVFQRCLGPNEPDLKEVVRHCRNVEDLLAFDSWTKYSGRVIPWPNTSHGLREGDWEIMPSFACIDAPVAGRWQWWRGYRRLWAPAPCLVDGALDIRINDDSISYDHDFSPVGRWNDWSWGLRYTKDANLPPATGQALFVRRELLEAFSGINKYTFCWIWRIIGYHRHGNRGKYDAFSLEGELGGSRICIA